MKFQYVVTLTLLFCLTANAGEASTGELDVQQMQASEQSLAALVDNNEQKALAILLGAYKKGIKGNFLNPDIPYFLAVLSVRRGDFKKGIRYLLEAKASYQKSGNKSAHSEMLLAKRLGDCYYEVRNTKKAIAEYKTAFEACRDLPNSHLSSEEILEGIVACNIAQEENIEAEKNCQMLIQTTHDRLKEGHFYDLTNYCWSLLALADFYYETKQLEKLESLRNDIRSLFSDLIRNRSKYPSLTKASDYKEGEILLRQEYMVELAPSTPAEKAWAANDYRGRTLPVVSWANVSGKRLATIVCLHGLGVENRAFLSSAAELNSRGYIVYSMDARGFGSWSQTKGMEHLDFSRTLSDIRNIVQLLREETPGTPIFLLGESMGGAIVLQAADDLSGLISGVISSVPSAERHQQRRMALTTAIHFVFGPKDAFSIADYVSQRATENEMLRTVWGKDPKSKMEYTPIELIKFDSFMRDTKKQAAKIDKLPILITQGLADRLVKPRGTFEIFDAIKSVDKTLLLIGTAEHLMFETTSPSPVLIDSLDSWLKKHLDCLLTGRVGL